MSPFSSVPSDESHLIPCHFLVYRMILADSEWLDEDGTLDPAVFYRRKQDKDGVSLATSVSVGLERLKKWGRAVEGCVSLHVGWVRNIEKLDVTRKDATDTHPVIIGLPYSHENPREAERLASQLLKIARNEPLPPTE